MDEMCDWGKGIQGGVWELNCQCIKKMKKACGSSATYVVAKRASRHAQVGFRSRISRTVGDALIPLQKIEMT
jgi:hypothetical protein